MVVGRGQAGSPADRAVDVSDDTTRPSNRAGLPAGSMRRTSPAAVSAGRAHHDLKGYGPRDRAPGGDRPDAGVVTVPDGLERRDAGGRHPQAGTAQLLGGGPVTSLSPAVLESSCPLAIAETDPTMDRVQVKTRAKPISNRNPDIHR